MSRTSIFQQQLQGLNISISATDYDYTQLRYPMVGLALYLLTVAVFQPSKQAEIEYEEKLKKDEKIKKKASRFGKTKLFMFIHNILLCIFSWLCFINTFPIVYNLLQQYGWKNTVCDHLTVIYQDSFGYWAHLFYLSKFYEFIDTWIVIARKRRPITLQVFHHCGAVLAMFLILITKSTGGYLFIILNSFIHGIMYFYYAMSTLGFSFNAKFLITSLQMLQLFQVILWLGCK